jgi:hypothetical protein
VKNVFTLILSPYQASDTVQRLQQDQHALLEELEACQHELEQLKVT